MNLQHWHLEKHTTLMSTVRGKIKETLGWCKEIQHSYMGPLLGPLFRTDLAFKTEVPPVAIGNKEL